MQSWPDCRLLDLLHLEIPIIQAPMAGADSIALARSVAKTGALGSLACALLGSGAVGQAAHALRDQMNRPINLNFFCHSMSLPTPAVRDKWKQKLSTHYKRLGLNIELIPESRLRMPFDDEMCDVLEKVMPEIVSFHFGLPAPALVERVKKQGAKVLSSATSVREAVWLQDHGCDAIIVQGAEAGGHRAMFLENDVASQVGLFALLPQVADAVSVPLIAAGGIADARSIVAAFALGACGVQLGSGYLLCPEANVSPLYRQALERSTDTSTAITNVFSGRPARGILNRYIREAGPMTDSVLAFPYAATLVAPLRAASEQSESHDYMQMWAGQAAGRAKTMPADRFTRELAADALRRMHPEATA